METNPLAPRQRNRRADRQAADASPVQQPVQRSVAPLPPVQPGYGQPVTYPQPRTQQPVYPQTPAAMYQQPVQRPYQPMGQAQTMYPPQPTRVSAPPVAPVQPVRPSGTSYPQTMPQYRQMGASAQPMAPAQPVQYTPRPRVLNQNGSSASTGWQQPTLHERAEVPHARVGRSLNRETAKAEKAAQREADAQARREAREKAEWEAEKARRASAKEEQKPAAKKLPGWLTTALSLCFIGVLALVAAYYLMQAYLVTEENKRIAAYEAVLDNYHITEQADGTLRVTWQEYIEKYAAEYNLQPAFVIAIIRNESSFRTNAESNVGARGLMQMMPDTAEWIAGKLDDHQYTFDSMYDAETNIRYGCWYLGYLSRLFRGDPVLVSAAYHAGQSTVTQWLSDPTKSADGVTLDPDKLTDGPTKQYIGRVTQTYGIYQTLLYPDEAFGAADAVSAGSASAAAAER